METNKPYPSIYDCMEDNPGVSLNVKLLYGGPITSSFISYGIDKSVAKCATVGTSNSLLKAWESFLTHGADFKILALLQILTFKRATYNVNKVFKLSDSKVNSIIHHFPQSLESFRWDVK